MEQVQASMCRLDPVADSVSHRRLDDLARVVRLVAQTRNEERNPCGMQAMPCSARVAPERRGLVRVMIGSGPAAGPSSGPFSEVFGRLVGAKRR